MVPLKIYAYAAGLILSICLLAFTHWKAVELGKTMQRDISAKERDKAHDAKVASLEAQIKASETQREILEAEKARINSDKETALDENKTLANDLASNRKRMRILVLQQKSCPSEAANASGTQGGYAEIAPEVRSDILNFREQLIKHDSAFDLCMFSLRQCSAD